jgi:hypothetical protein
MPGQPIVDLPGDIVLLHRPSNGGPVSELIRKATGSPYTHTMVSLGGGDLAEANLKPGDEPDVLQRSVRQVAKKLTETHSAHLFRLKTGPVREEVIRARFEDWRAKARPRGPTRATSVELADTQNLVRFNLAAMGMLAPLSAVIERAGRDPHDQWARLRDAMFVTLSNGIWSVWCSEFAHRLLAESGHRPSLPSTPWITLPADIDDEPVLAFGLLDWWNTFARWAKKRYAEIQRWSGIANDAWPDAKEILKEIRTNFDIGARPTRLEVADFFAPVDFANSGSFTLIAKADATNPTWQRYPG